MRIRSLTLGLCLGAVAAAAFAQDARRNYIVQLADDPAASYNGGRAGLAATRPAAGQRFNVNAAHVQSYLAYLDRKAASVTAAVPSAQVYARYGVAFNGFAAKLSDADVAKLKSMAGVVAVVPDELRKLDTSYTPGYLGLTDPTRGIWNRTDGQGRLIKGENVIIGHVDGGVWPENPSFSDKVDPVSGKPVPYYAPGTVVYGAPPAKWAGTCQTGIGFTAAMCNNKLIGARYFNAGWKAARPNPAQWWSFEYIDSPRDADGHGSHTLSTSGGNEGVDGNVGGTTLVPNVSGIAPRARVASYKVCYNATNGPGDTNGGCFGSDSVAAINQAVADGVDVINYSISGSRTSFTDPVETAFRNAAFAGVFVSASAGNSNVFPGNASTVAHNSPWIMTVGNSTHDRYTEAVVTLGNAQQAQGASFQTAGVPTSPLVWSRNVGFGAPAAQNSNQALCLGPADGVAPLLDPAQVAGKILVCDRGGNVLVNKVANARTAGAVGVIIQNTPVSANTTPIISAVLPTVHLAAVHFAAVTGHASTAGATASFGGSFLVAGTISPVMNNSSSRGPNQADADMMKPDITAPGTDIIAAYANRGLTQADRDAIAGGNFAAATPWYDMISGTSMSSPHIAGMAALLRQANPTWSPYAIKSALMTSAAQTVKLANGTPDPSPHGFGAGHANPNSALETSVVYDSTNADHLAYYNRALPGGGSSLNVASMTRGNSVGTAAFTRTLTNKGTVSQTFNASASLAGFSVVVNPSSLTLAPGESKSYSVTATPTTAPANTYVFGHVTWTRDDNQNVLRSPLTVRYSKYSGPTAAADTRPVGTKVWTVATGFSGQMRTQPFGLVPAVRTSATVSTGGPIEQCGPDITVPAGAKMLRAQTFNSETQGGSGTDIDLYVYRIDGATRTLVGGSESGTTDELVSIANPSAGTYRACAQAFAPVGVARSTVINTWMVDTSTPNLRAFGPSSATIGGTASVGIAWNVPVGNRYIGLVEISNPPNAGVLGSTLVFIDTMQGAAAPAAEALLREPESKLR